MNFERVLNAPFQSAQELGREKRPDPSQDVVPGRDLVGFRTQGVLDSFHFVRNGQPKALIPFHVR